MLEGDPKKITPEALGIEKTEDGVKIKERATKNDVIVHEKSKAQQLSETFFGGTAKDAAKSVVNDVLVPALKQTLYDMISTGFQRLLFGNTVSNGRPVIGRPSYSNRYNYNAAYRSNTRQMSKAARGAHDFNTIVFKTRAEAEDILSRMYTAINEYGQTTVADFYQMSGVSTTPQDFDWGWTDVRRSRIISTQDGWIIDFPQPGALNR